MSFFKCKMCGGTLEIQPNATVAECEYCGTTQTLPKLDDGRKANLFDRANHFRRNNEFDKAAGIYEQILNEDSTDAETYWSLVLCRYGIEYVEDPATHKRVPTVNRAQFTSIFDDDNYKSALNSADGYQRSIYEDEAKAINEIQKGILAISQKEEPFDVFICYKETDNSGRRTPDSVLATDLYHQLTQEGFKVFFSRITLEDKLGTAYEPYIFAALNSAKVMVVLGTKPEYFNAVWVKNEWSRYLALIKSGAKKLLIPAYKDMDPYDLPEEFSHLQAQDMSKLGFMQDLIRGVKKILAEDAPKPAAKETVVVNAGNANTAALLERAFMFLEDGDWQSADEYCERVLDVDPKNAEAYLGKLMAELQINKRDMLLSCENPFDDNNNYKKALRFADAKLQRELTGTIACINERIENERKDAIYAEALADANSNALVTVKDAIKQFEMIAGWRDADHQIALCNSRIEEIKKQEEIARLEQERQANLRKQENAVKAKRFKKMISIATPIILVCTVGFVLINTVFNPNSKKYKEAISLMNARQYNEAITLFSEVNGYKNSDEKIVDCQYQVAIELMEAGQYSEAKELFTANYGYQYSADYISFLDGVEAKNAEEYATALQRFSEIEERNLFGEHLEKLETECSDIIRDIYFYVVNSDAIDLLSALECLSKLPNDYEDVEAFIAELQEYAGLLGPYYYTSEHGTYELEIDFELRNGNIHPIVKKCTTHAIEFYDTAEITRTNAGDYTHLISTSGLGLFNQKDREYFIYINSQKAYASIDSPGGSSGYTFTR